MTTQPERLHHLPAEAEQLAQLVEELEARIVTLEHVAAGNKRHVQLIVPDLEKAEARVRELEANTATLQEALATVTGQCRGLEARVRELTKAKP